MKLLMFAILALTGTLSATPFEEAPCGEEKTNFSYFPDMRNLNSFRAYYTMLCYMDKSCGPLKFVPYPSVKFSGVKDELDYLIFFDYFVEKNGRLKKFKFSDLPKSGGDAFFEDFRSAMKADIIPKITD